MATCFNATETPSAPSESTAPLLLTADQFAAMLGISKRTLWRLRAAGHLPAHVRLGGMIRWRTDSVRGWIERNCSPISQRSAHATNSRRRP